MINTMTFQAAYLPHFQSKSLYVKVLLYFW